MVIDYTYINKNQQSPRILTELIEHNKTALKVLKI
jgi:hypothetical protein